MAMPVAQVPVVKVPIGEPAATAPVQVPVLPETSPARAGHAAEGVAVEVGRAVRLGVCDGVDGGVSVADCEAGSDGEPVCEGEAVLEGELEMDAPPDNVADGEAVPLALSVAVELDEGVPDLEGV